MKISRNAWGIATLELALSGTLLLGLALGGFGILDYLDQLRFINLLVERNLGDHGFKPLVLGGNTGKVIVDAVGLEAYLDDVISGVEADLQEHYPSLQLYFAQSAACVVHIHPMSGASLGVDISSCVSKLRGSLTVPTALLNDSDLVHEFQQQAMSLQVGAGASTGVSLLAVPSGTFGRDAGAEQYLDRAVVAGLRVFASLENSLAGSAYAQFGADGLVYNKRFIHLRGLMQ